MSTGSDIFLEYATIPRKIREDIYAPYLFRGFGVVRLERLVISRVIDRFSDIYPI